MPFIPETISMKRKYRVVVCALLLLTLIALSAFGLVRGKANTRGKASRAPSAGSELTKPVMKTESAELRLETEVITITPRGFEPAAITRPAGRFILLVENRTELSDLELRIYNERGVCLRERRLSREERDWIEGLDLAPGHYVLKETNHSQWSCQFTITR